MTRILRSEKWRRNQTFRGTKGTCRFLCDVPPRLAVDDGKNRVLCDVVFLGQLALRNFSGCVLGPNGANGIFRQLGPTVFFSSRMSTVNDAICLIFFVCSPLQI